MVPGESESLPRPAADKTPDSKRAVEDLLELDLPPPHNRGAQTAMNRIRSLQVVRVYLQDLDVLLIDKICSILAAQWTGCRLEAWASKPQLTALWEFQLMTIANCHPWVVVHNMRRLGCS